MSRLASKLFASRTRALWVLSPLCLGCGSERASFFPGALSDGFCEACAPSLLTTEDPRGPEKITCVQYGGAVEVLVSRIKHGQRPDLCAPWARACAPEIARKLELVIPDGMQSVDCIVPVPAHPLHAWSRGFDAAHLVAVALGTYFQRPLATNLLRRSAWTASQKLLPRSKRQLNATSGFYDTGRRAPPNVLLVDDVCTTGATLRACRSLLLASGAEFVASLALAERVRHDLP